MKLSDLTSFISNSNREDRTSFLESLLDSDRNKLIDVHRDYYNGIHWMFGESSDDKTNRTRSGKLIWGKSNNINTNDAYQRERGTSLGFHRGQLQTYNYIKSFIQIYQDFAIGNNVDDIKVTYEPTATEAEVEAVAQGEGIEQIDTNTERIQEFIDNFWIDIDSYLKTQMARMILNTVAIGSVQMDEQTGEMYPEVEDARKIFPVYHKTRMVGVISAYYIDAAHARILGVDTKDDVIYSELYYQEEGQFYYVKMIDGKVILEDGKPIPLPEEMNFNPYTIVANIDHAYRMFDTTSLEDSEIFNWIDKVDALNSNATIEFITNQYLVMPKVTLDFQMAKEMNVNINDPAFRQALRRFQFAPGSIDSVPFKLHDGKSIPDSFYKGKTQIKDALFEDASIPQFLMNAQGMSNIKVETLQLGMSMLTRKINQKRAQLTRLIQEQTAKALKAAGLVTEANREVENNVHVNYPDIGGMTRKELLEHFSQAAQTGLYPKRYSQEESLKLIGKEEDIPEVKEAEQNELIRINQEIQQQRSIVENEQLAQAQVQQREQQLSERQQLEEQLNQIQ